MSDPSVTVVEVVSLAAEAAQPGDDQPSAESTMHFSIEFDHEEDGRWIAEVPELPGVMVYGDSQEDAKNKVGALALRVLADKIERENVSPNHVEFEFA